MNGVNEVKINVVLIIVSIELTHLPFQWPVSEGVDGTG